MREDSSQNEGSSLTNVLLEVSTKNSASDKAETPKKITRCSVRLRDK